jgi:hypothetical protein
VRITDPRGGIIRDEARRIAVKHHQIAGAAVEQPTERMVASDCYIADTVLTTISHYTTCAHGWWSGTHPPSALGGSGVVGDASVSGPGIAPDSDFRHSVTNPLAP